MRLFDVLKNITSAGWLAIVFPLALIVPNFVLNFTEGLPLVASLANIFLPLGCYAALLSLSRQVGVSVLCCLPLMVFSAFQIVLLYLYGESIIAVDMFLNVVTTNAREVSELLGNLLIAIGTVVALYMPMIVWAVTLSFRHRRLSGAFIMTYRRVALVLLICGSVFAGLSYGLPGYAVDEDLFPVNVMHNLVIAVKRGMASAAYPETSAGFSFGAVSTRDSLQREVYVLVIGETSRADNWQLLGYDRETNPRLSAIERLVAFPRAMTQSNTTHKSVPMLLSDLTAADFDSIAYRKSVITAFNEAGFHTSFFSNQRRNGSYIDFFGFEADTAVFLKDDGAEHLDADLVSLTRRQLQASAYRKQLIVLHTYGSHFNYRDRYDDGFSYFTPDHVVDANSSHRRELINAFDNTIRYIDNYLADIMEALEAEGVCGAVVYASDHGEDIFDDDRNRFLHASPTPTATQLHVPMLVWVSGHYNELYPETLVAMEGNRNAFLSPSVSVFHTLVDIAAIDFDRYKPCCSLASTDYRSPGKYYLTDRNERVGLMDSGLRKQDIEKLKKRNLL